MTRTSIKSLGWVLLPLSLALYGCEGIVEGGPDSGLVDGGAGIDLPPTVASFVANPAGVRPAGTSTLTYRVSEATSVRLVNQATQEVLLESDALSGQIVTAPLAATTRFTLFAIDATRTTTRSIEVVVDARGEDSVAHVEIRTTTISTATVAPEGRSVLRWTTRYARSGQVRRLDGDIIYEIPETRLDEGAFELRPAATTAYEISFVGIDRQAVVRYVAVHVSADGRGRLLERFDSQIRPSLEARCASCHSGAAPRGPVFLPGPIQDWYAALAADPRFVNRPESSLLFWKGEHAGPNFDVATRTQLVTWLFEESLARRIDIPAPSPATRTLQEGLARLQACLDLPTWNATYGREPVQHTSEIGYELTTGIGGSGGGTCVGCHSFGTGGVFFKATSNETWEASRRAPAVLKILTPTYAVNAAFTGFVAAGRWRTKGVDPLHPQFTLSAERETTLETLATGLIARFANPQLRCDEPVTAP